MRFRSLVRSSICTAVLCTAVSAQETKQNQSALPQQASANQGANKSASQAIVTPQQLAAGWALDNQEEVILSKFAQEKSKNPDVSKFAKMMAEEHQECLKKISKFAPEASREGFLSENQADPSKSREGSTATGTTDQPKNTSLSGTNSQNANAARSSTSGIDMMQLQREIAQQCVSDTKKYLNTKDGDEFDKTFVGMQIAKHAAMHTKLVVLQRHTTDEMRQMVVEGIQATEKHMKAAETLMAKLDHADGSTSSKKNEK